MVEVVLHKSQGIDNFHLTEQNRKKSNNINNDRNGSVFCYWPTAFTVK
jgi:hypothetical protein